MGIRFENGINAKSWFRFNLNTRVVYLLLLHMKRGVTECNRQLVHAWMLTWENGESWHQIKFK